jgi:dihydrofolate synthase/folylpolyglutamate synthase
MNYKASLAYIMEQLPMYQHIGRTAYRTGLDNTIRLDDYFNHPHHQFKTIHVAGTNGKGSVSHMLASVLQEAGYTVGLYTSPHLLDFRERIRINGKMINKKFVTGFVSRHKKFFGTFDPSFFEISVFMAFEYFTQSRADIAVIEVGLGGRLDATNIISPVLSVITNIGRDHMEILGETPEKIAAEKAGIIKAKTPVVIGESQIETLSVFKDHSDRHESPMIIADALYGIDESHMSDDGYQVFNVKRKDDVTLANLKCGLLGFYQRKNTVTVLAAIDAIGKYCRSIQIDEKEMYAGIRKVVRNTGLSGRWQRISRNPDIICDTAHNADGIRAVLLQVKEMPYKRLHMIIGFVSDKDVKEILRFMPESALYYFVRLTVPRTMDQDQLASAAYQYGLKGQSFGHISAAYEKVKENAGKDDLVIITGSNFLVADFLSLHT